MPVSKPRKGLAKKQVIGRIAVTEQGLQELTERWETARANQIAVINRLYAIIDFTRETANSPSLTSDEKVELIKKRMP